VVEAFNIPLTGKDVACLRDGTWLTDEVMNFYTELLLERNRRVFESAQPGSDQEGLGSAFNRYLRSAVPRVHMFNT